MRMHYIKAVEVAVVGVMLTGAPCISTSKDFDPYVSTRVFISDWCPADDNSGAQLLAPLVVGLLAGIAPNLASSVVDYVGATIANAGAASSRTDQAETANYFYVQYIPTTAPKTPSAAYRAPSPTPSASAPAPLVPGASTSMLSTPFHVLGGRQRASPGMTFVKEPTSPQLQLNKGGLQCIQIIRGSFGAQASGATPPAPSSASKEFQAFWQYLADPSLGDALHGLQGEPELYFQASIEWDKTGSAFRLHPMDFYFGTQGASSGKSSFTFATSFSVPKAGTGGDVFASFLFTVPEVAPGQFLNHDQFQEVTTEWQPVRPTADTTAPASAMLKDSAEFCAGSAGDCKPQLGPFNLKVSVTTSKDANAFLQKLGAFISQSKDQVQTSVQNAVDPAKKLQTAVSTDALVSKAVAAKGLVAVKLAALADENANSSATKTEKAQAAQDVLQAKLDANSAAIAAGQPIPFPEVYSQ
ncbi:Uncharacterised protein [Burkholderia pseudomallei]|nr:Uncharacterised protein [Burkholderia pseudomallei]VBC15496.1 Uncharacterised protein [Burkholderia pseudomallei]VBS98804.1 Uncharacterised protein [Burkholderia pseudomallei]